MPGITGIISLTLESKLELQLDAMLGSMCHEPFYSSGRYINRELGLAIGWTSATSVERIVWSRRKDICLIISGEIFSLNGTEKDSAGRTEKASALLALYESIGPASFEHINGWFSGVLVDLRESKILLFNDRYGVQRLYVHEDSTGLYFSSEAKSLLTALPQARELDKVALGEYCSCGCVLQNRSLFHGISLLPGASIWCYGRGCPPQKTTYFRPETWEALPQLEPKLFYESLKETFKRILPRYFDAGERIGMSLTGGLDGRMIMAYAGWSRNSVPCYTFASAYRDCTDVRAARKLASACGQSHQVITVDGAFLKDFSRLAEEAVYLSDGAMDVTGAVELYVNKVAREIAPIRITGNYGSEVLRGNIAFKPHALDRAIYDSELVKSGTAAAHTYAAEKQCHPVSFIAFKQVPWHHYSRLSVEQTQLTLRAPYLDNDLVRLMYRAPRESIRSKEASLRLIWEGNPSIGRIPTDRGLLYRPIPVFTKARHLFEEFTFRAEYTYDYGMPQNIAAVDCLLKSLHLEKLFLGRHKFFHFRVWYRDKLSAYIKEVLLDPRTRRRPYLNGAHLEDMVQGHLRGNRNYTTEIHKILTLELIQQQLIERDWRRAR
jgi:asparagine synthase (glutamine-hydrolysing)